MTNFFNGNRRKIISIIALAAIAVASLVYTQYIIDKLMEQERASVSLWAKAIEYNSRDLYPETRRELDGLRKNLSDLTNVTPVQMLEWNRIIENAQTELSNAALDFVSDLIIENRSEIPSIVTDADGNIINSNNVDERQLVPATVQQFATLNTPIRISVQRFDGGIDYQFVYYGHSGIIQSLRFFPYLQFSLLTIFLALVYTNLMNIRKTEQSNLWVGMAKEAAHQLGTPLSSMFGWIELLRTNAQDDSTLNIVHELEEDVRRLQKVAERFNKIGSGTELKIQRIEPILTTVIEYIEKRLPQFRKNVMIRKHIDEDLKVPINGDLFTWAIENLMKNALDAVDSQQENAFVEIRSFVEQNELVIEIQDSGKGIEKRHFEEIFKPGYSTKKRGWGLGLSLTRRIIEDYHGGRIFIHNSVIGEGTTFRLMIPIETKS
jgi:signal transduction histidine kinase